jgi:hypothetical protein
MRRRLDSIFLSRYEELCSYPDNDSNAFLLTAYFAFTVPNVVPTWTSGDHMTEGQFHV